ncbi:YibE/F family protein [Fusibacter sp. JL216-2]|uniref:YibE/F family protein n=1 Tax=Fusibacter sp. JL216-2 TaxID=3071453 RepID=UPI003D328C13
MKKRISILVIILMMLVSSFVFADNIMSQDDELTSFVEHGRVIDVTEFPLSEDDSYGEMIQEVQVQIVSGKYEGEIHETDNVLSGHPGYDIPVKIGDKVIIQVDEYSDGDVDVFVTDYNREGYLKWLVIGFIAVLVLVGKLKGLKTVVTIGITLVMVWKFIIPGILNGLSPVPITVMSCIVITVVTILLVSGFRKKSIAAIIGTISGVLIAGGIAYLIGQHVKMTGMSTEEASMLLYIPQGIQFDFKALLFSGILLGALGAVMDVAMSIASSIEEVYKANKELSRGELFSAGMEVGKDVMGTMSNTLILAYTGSSIPLLLLFMAYDTPLVRMLNLDIIATEIVRSLAGSIGLILTIPLTAVVTVLLLKPEPIANVEQKRALAAESADQ